MSDHQGASHAQPKSEAGLPVGRDAPLRRWPLYLGLTVIAVLLIAYFDAGEEPIRPITEPIALPSGGAAE